MGKVDEDPHVHGAAAGLLALGIAYIAWHFNSIGVCIIAGLIGAFMFISGIVMSVKEDMK